MSLEIETRAKIDSYEGYLNDFDGLNLNEKTAVQLVKLNLEPRINMLRVLGLITVIPTITVKLTKDEKVEIKITPRSYEEEEDAVKIAPSKQEDLDFLTSSEVSVVIDYSKKTWDNEIISLPGSLVEKWLPDILAILFVAQNSILPQDVPLPEPEILPLSPIGVHVEAKSYNLVSVTWFNIDETDSTIILQRSDDLGGTYIDLANFPSVVDAYDDVNVFPNTEYHYRLYVSGPKGKSEPTTPIVVTTPVSPVSAPDGLVAIALSGSSVRLTWADQSDNEDGFIIQRLPPNSQTWVSIGSVGSDVVEFTDNGLSELTTYRYRVYAFSQSLNQTSGFSNEVEISTLENPLTPPAAPTNLSGDPSPSLSSEYIDLIWTDNAFNEDGFILQIRDEPGSFENGTQVSLANNATSYHHEGLAAETSYGYRVAAFNLAGQSAWSNEVVVSTAAAPIVAPTAPENLAALAVSTSQLELSWDNTSTTADGIYVERKEGVGSFELIDTLNSTEDVYSDAGLSASTGYTYRLAAFNTAGTSDYSNEASATTLDNPIPEVLSGFIADTFQRTVQSGWGTSDIGGDWERLVSHENNFNVYDGQANLVMNNSAERLIHLPETQITNLDAKVKFTWSGNIGSPTGHTLFSYLVLRRQSSGDYYRFGMSVDPASTSIRLHGQTNSGLNLFSDTTTDMNYLPQSGYWMRVVLTGTSPTFINMRAWTEGDTEPASWDISTTDSKATPVQTSGTVGIRAIGSHSPAVPYTASFDSLVISGIEVPPPDTAFLRDRFNRTVAAGWGTPDIGGTWSLRPNAGTVNDFFISNGVGTAVAVSGNTTGSVIVNSGENQMLTHSDVFSWVTFSGSHNDNGALLCYFLSRVQETLQHNYYRLGFGPGTNSVWVRAFSVNNNASTSLFTGAVVTGLAYNGTQQTYGIRVITSGINPTNLKLKVWASGTVEPSVWNYDFNNTASHLQTSGWLGFRILNTNTEPDSWFRFKDLVGWNISGVLPQEVAPDAPANLAADAGDSSMSLIWNEVVTATGYNVYRTTTSGSGHTRRASVVVTGYTDNGLTNDTSYYYFVRAENNVGESTDSNYVGNTPRDQSPPAAPTGLTATAGNAQVSLSWNSSALATGYRVYRGTVNGGPYTFVIATTNTSYTNTGLTNGTTYYFVVTATNVNGESNNSNQDSATPTGGGGGGDNSGGLTVIAAHRAYDVHHSIGVNCHFGFGGQVYDTDWTNVRAKLIELKIKHIRDNIETTTTFRDRMLALYNQEGIRMTVSPVGGQSETVRQPSYFDWIYNNMRPALEAIEGPNEQDYNAAGGTACWTTQKNLWTAIRNNHGDSTFPIWCASPHNPQGNTILQNAASGDAAVPGASATDKWRARHDMGNIHSYNGGLPVGNSRIEEWLTESARINGTFNSTNPVIATETGYHTAVNGTSGHLPCSERAAGKYMPRLILFYKNRGLTRLYIYQLADGLSPGTNTTDLEHAFGMHKSAVINGVFQLTTPRPQFWTVKNLISLIEDTNGASITPLGLGFTITNNSGRRIERCLIRHSSGKWLLAIWQEVSCYNVNQRTEIINSDVQITVNFGTASRSWTVRGLSSTGTGTPIRASGTGTSATFMVPDEVVVMEIPGP